jgi:hypothetical protein
VTIGIGEARSAHAEFAKFKREVARRIGGEFSGVFQPRCVTFVRERFQREDERKVSEVDRNQESLYVSGFFKPRLVFFTGTITPCPMP